MKKFAGIVILGALVLSACGGPKTVNVGTAELTYNSGTWKTFSNDLGNGLAAKKDPSCWVDTQGTKTTPTESEGLKTASEGGITLYTDETGTNQYISFIVSGTTVSARVSVEDSAGCTGKIMQLAEENK